MIPGAIEPLMRIFLHQRDCHQYVTAFVFLGAVRSNRNDI